MLNRDCIRSTQRPSLACSPLSRSVLPRLRGGPGAPAPQSVQRQRPAPVAILCSSVDLSKCARVRRPRRYMPTPTPFTSAVAVVLVALYCGRSPAPTSPQSASPPAVLDCNCGGGSAPAPTPAASAPSAQQAPSASEAGPGCWSTGALVAGVTAGAAAGAVGGGALVAWGLSGFVKAAFVGQCRRRKRIAGLDNVIPLENW